MKVKGTVGETSERWGGVHTGIPERIDIILSRTKLTETQGTEAVEQGGGGVSTEAVEQGGGGGVTEAVEQGGDGVSLKL